jgi:hypothetical protein
MRGLGEYQQRVEHCIARARAAAHETDRARWLQLAEQWALLTRLGIQRLPSDRTELAGLWRGESAAHG